MKPLTIEELKALPVGEWVWVVSRLSNIGIYEQIRCSDNTSIFFDSGYCISYSEYETKWLIYKNKEQAESKEIKKSDVIDFIEELAWEEIKYNAMQSTMGEFTGSTMAIPRYAKPYFKLWKDMFGEELKEE